MSSRIAAQAARDHYVLLLHRALQGEVEGQSVALRGAVGRGVLREAATRRLPPAASAVIPKGWRAAATQTLQRGFSGLLEPSELLRSDLFLMALIHPSCVRLPSPAGPGGQRARVQALALRRECTLPPEIALAGSSSIRLLAEMGTCFSTSAAHAAGEVARGEEQIPRSPSTSSTREGSEALSTIPITSTTVDDIITYTGVGAHVLFDREAFPPTGGALPQEVSESCAVALCGALELTRGIESVASLIDAAQQHTKDAKAATK